MTVRTMHDQAPIASTRAAVDPTPLVSVLVASFNHARYLEDCLDSLLHDGYENLELVLTDDGSSDDCFEIATRWVEDGTAVDGRAVARVRVALAWEAMKATSAQ